MPVYVTEAVDTPCLFGLVRPAVYLTPEAAGDDVTRQHSVAHELTHHVEHLANAHGLDDKDEEQLLQLMQEYAEGN